MPIIERVCFGASRKSFNVVASLCRAVVDKIARPIVEAIASDTMQNRASRANFVALTPPYYSKCYVKLVFLFSAT